MHLGVCNRMIVINMVFINVWVLILIVAVSA